MEKAVNKSQKAAMSSGDEGIVVYKRRKMKDEMIPLAEFYKNMKPMKDEMIESPMSRRPISLKKKKKKSSMGTRNRDDKKNRGSVLCYGSADGDEQKLSEEDSEEEKKKYLCRSPVVIEDVKDFVASFRLRAFGAQAQEPEEEKPEEESEDELLRERDRNEVDWCYKYVLRKRWRAITNPVNPKKIYYKSDADHIENVLHDPECPLATLSKLALRNYNAIQGTHYKYVGLVKAYMQIVDGSYYDIRFKARLLGQDAINFQATIYEGIRLRKIKVVPVRVVSVYPC